MRIMLVVGTRPEAIKLAPIALRLRATPAVSCMILSTGQHDELALDALSLFGIEPDVNLSVMRSGQTPTQVAAAVLAGLEPHIRGWNPDWVIVQGDTTSVVAASIAAHYGRARIAHVEAGLRSHDRGNPFPEEFNRVLVSHAADLHFAPTVGARDNLLREGVAADSILVTGNTVVDALQFIRTQSRRPYQSDPISEIPLGRRIILVTTHRRENFGTPLDSICTALIRLSRRGDVHIVLPLHPNPTVREQLITRLGMNPHIALLEPLDYASLIHVLSCCHLVLTDSGGLQEEAPSFGKPVLVLREVTERPEGITAGCARLVGTEPERIVGAVSLLLDDSAAYRQMAQAANPYGDGHAADRIVAALVSLNKALTTESAASTKTIVDS